MQSAVSIPYVPSQASLTSFMVSRFSLGDLSRAHKLLMDRCGFPINCPRFRRHPSPNTSQVIARSARLAQRFSSDSPTATNSEILSLFPPEAPTPSRVLHPNRKSLFPGPLSRRRRTRLGYLAGMAESISSLPILWEEPPGAWLRIRRGKRRGALLEVRVKTISKVRVKTTRSPARTEIRFL